MSELQLLEDTKKRWLEQFNGYALILIKAVLAMGEDDDMGDLASIERHHLKAKSMGYNMPQGDVKIIATEKTSLYVPAMKEFSVTQRLIFFDCGNAPRFTSPRVKGQLHDAATYTQKYPIFQPDKVSEKSVAMLFPDKLAGVVFQLVRRDT